MRSYSLGRATVRAGDKGGSAQPSPATEVSDPAAKANGEPVLEAPQEGDLEARAEKVNANDDIESGEGEKTLTEDPGIVETPSA
jgi:hypothetical protein